MTFSIVTFSAIEQTVSRKYPRSRTCVNAVRRTSEICCRSAYVRYFIYVVIITIQFQKFRLKIFTSIRYIQQALHKLIRTWKISLTEAINWQKYQ